MTITERPLFGSVEIHRVEDAWTEHRRNLFRNPRARDVGSFGSHFSAWAGNSATGVMGYAPAAWPASGSVAQFERTSAAWSSETIGVVVNGIGLVVGEVYTVAFDLVINRAASVAGISRGGSNSTGWDVLAYGPAAGPMPAGVPVRQWVTIRAGSGTGARVYRAWSGQLAGDVSQLSNVDIYAGPYQPDRQVVAGDASGQSAIERYRWLGAADASASVFEIGGTELIGHATNATIRRGGSRTGLGIKTDAGILTFQLLNAHDPLAGGDLQPGQLVRAVSRDGAGYLSELFTGRVVDVASNYVLNKSTGRLRSIVTVTVADAVKIHAETPRYGVQLSAGFETFESRIGRLAGSALAPVEAPAEGAPREVYAF